MYKHLKYSYILFLLCLVSCSSDDTDEFQDAVTLNVMNEVNGKTFIGNSDVFLNKNNNFQSESWYIAPTGTLDKETHPDLVSLIREVAAEPNHLYCLYDPESLMTFPSSEQAIFVGSAYYKLLVESNIPSNDLIQGMKVKYKRMIVSDNKLPAKDTMIGSMANVGDEISYNIGNVAEYAFDEALSYNQDCFDISLSNGVLKIIQKKTIDKIHGPYGDYKIFIRSGNVFTSLAFQVGV